MGVLQQKLLRIIMVLSILLIIVIACDQLKGFFYGSHGQNRTTYPDDPERSVQSTVYSPNKSATIGFPSSEE